MWYVGRKHRVTAQVVQPDYLEMIQHFLCSCSGNWDLLVSGWTCLTSGDHIEKVCMDRKNECPAMWDLFLKIANSQVSIMASKTYHRCRQWM